MKVLIADDSKLMRDRIKETLSIFSNVEIIAETDNGWQTLEELNRHNPELAIIDIRMPDSNGLEIIKDYRLKNLSTKIVILTNYPYDQYRDKAVENGADYFFNKSEDFEKIGVVVASMLKKFNPFGLLI